MHLRYSDDTATIRDTMAPIGYGGLGLGGLGLAGMAYDGLLHGAFWGWGILTTILVCLVASAWLCTCYRVIVVDRGRGIVSAVFRGGYGFKQTNSYLVPAKIERPLEDFVSVQTIRRFERRESGGGEVAMYYVALETEDGEIFPVQRYFSESYLRKETAKLAKFLGLPEGRKYADKGS